MRRAARIDQNHTQVVKALEAIGCSVYSSAGLGGGFPDLVVARAKNTVLVEIKAGAKKKLTPAQQAFWLRWTGRIIRADSAAEAVSKVLRET